MKLYYDWKDEDPNGAAPLSENGMCKFTLFISQRHCFGSCPKILLLFTSQDFGSVHIPRCNFWSHPTISVLFASRDVISTHVLRFRFCSYPTILIVHFSRFRF